MQNHRFNRKESILWGKWSKISAIKCKIYDTKQVKQTETLQNYRDVFCLFGKMPKVPKVQVEPKKEFNTVKMNLGENWNKRSKHVGLQKTGHNVNG